MKKILTTAAIISVLMAVVLLVNAHPGRTDNNGGHTNQNTGEYHYHHGYSEHNHYDLDGDGDLDCPYNFDDNTGIPFKSTSNVSAETTIPPETTLIQSKQTQQQNGGYNVKIWVVCLLVAIFVIVIVAMYKSIRKKEEIIADLNKKHRESIQENEKNFNKDLYNFNSDIAKAYGSQYLCKVCNAPFGDCLGEDNLPRSIITDSHKWGKKYTFYLHSMYGVNSQRYHTPTCRFAEFGFPTNAYTIKRSANKYAPCSICHPMLPNLDWVSKYLMHKEFLERHEISVPEFYYTEERPQ